MKQLRAEDYDGFVNGEEVEFDQSDKITCKSHDDRTIEISIAPPFRFLGYGREKIVVSGLVDGLEPITGVTGVTRIAIGLKRTNYGTLATLNGIHSFRLLKKLHPHVPTYPWYVQSVDHQIALMSDLTQEGLVISQNKLNYTEEEKARLDAGFDEIIEQLKTMIDEEFPPTIMVSYDTYFAILGEATNHVMLGDFDGCNIQLSSLNEKIHNRRQVEHWVEMVDKNSGIKKRLGDFWDWVNQHQIGPR